MNCPRCSDVLHVVDLRLAGSFIVERCIQCHGTFFDRGELEQLIQHSVDNILDTDYGELQRLIQEETHTDAPPMAYVQCPVCAKHMNRKNYGARSGVVVDTCKECGVWLDGGELGRILKWAKAGGQTHSGALQEEKERSDRSYQAVVSTPIGAEPVN
ncbi:MAG: zf-TFIIB domain-containing protein, partial [Bdellovibrionales bacterium]|nr:zf-TFIIB domain-containing protein [Bdellovibrionales bacterium]